MGRLRPVERLLLADGSEAVVATLQREYAPVIFENWTPGKAATGTLGTPADPATGTFTTYNFEVADWHTYFAAGIGAAAWVHSTGALCPKIIEAATRKPELVNKMDLDKQVRRELEDMGLLPRKRLRDEQGRFVADPANPKSPHNYTDAQRRQDWKRIAEDPNSPLTPEQRQMVKDRGGRGPQRINEYGELETMELSHEPTPLRHGGSNVVPRWPADHAAVDPHRKLKNR